MIYITYSIRGVGEGAMIFVSRTANENSKTNKKLACLCAVSVFFFAKKKKENDELMGADK